MMNHKNVGYCFFVVVVVGVWKVFLYYDYISATCFMFGVLEYILLLCVREKKRKVMKNCVGISICELMLNIQTSIDWRELKVQIAVMKYYVRLKRCTKLRWLPQVGSLLSFFL